MPLPNAKQGRENSGIALCRVRPLNPPSGLWRTNAVTGDGACCRGQRAGLGLFSAPSVFSPPELRRSGADATALAALAATPAALAAARQRPPELCLRCFHCGGPAQRGGIRRTQRSGACSCRAGVAQGRGGDSRTPLHAESI